MKFDNIFDSTVNIDVNGINTKIKSIVFNKINNTAINADVTFKNREHKEYIFDPSCESEDNIIKLLKKVYEYFCK